MLDNPKGRLAGRWELQALPLPIEVANCGPDEHGTEVSLSALDQHWNYPTAERLKELLVLEYGREEGFHIVVNGKAVGIEDVRGTPAIADMALPTAGPVVLRLRITEDQQPAKQAGIVLRIGGKIIGRPSYFGLDLASDIPAKVLRRVYGEIEADGLSEDIAGNGQATASRLLRTAKHTVKSRPSSKRPCASIFLRHAIGR
ncbi:MAG: hypothetical protein JNN08_32230 [Bryobacterales bacterium]|nr:hypothetical protein [Bryobacterales bacterium]